MASAAAAKKWPREEKTGARGWELGAGRAVAEGFPGELKSGRLEFREVNIDEPQNRHFVDEYQLSSQSLVIVEVRDGRQVRWRNLEKVWTLLESEREFIPYVRDGVSGFLKSA